MQALNNQAPTIQPLSFDDHVIAMAKLFDANVAEFNDVADHAEALEKQLAEVTATADALQGERDETKKLLVAMTERMIRLKTENERHEEKLATAADVILRQQQAKGENNSLKLQLNQIKNERDDLKESNARFKEIAGTPKKIKELIKRQKDNVATWTEKANSKDKQLKVMRAENRDQKGRINDLLARVAQESIFAPMVYDNGDYLVMWPRFMGPKEEMGMVYLSAEGRGAVIQLDDEDEPTLAPAPKRGLRPAQRLKDDAGMILRRFKRQDWKISGDDMAWFEANARGDFEG